MAESETMDGIDHSEDLKADRGEVADRIGVGEGSEDFVELSIVEHPARSVATVVGDKRGAVAGRDGGEGVGRHGIGVVNATGTERIGGYIGERATRRG